MSEEFTNELVSQTASSRLIKEGNELTDMLVSTNDSAELDRLEKLFNNNIKKKNMARLNKLTNILELVDDETIQRFLNEPESFDNDQLLKYSNSMQKSILDIDASIKNAPIIQINQQENVNVNMEFNQESRKRILDAVNSILNDVKQKESIDVDFEESEE